MGQGCPRFPVYREETPASMGNLESAVTKREEMLERKEVTKEQPIPL